MGIAEKLSQIAENEQKVYDAGFAAGQAQGGGGSYDQGYTDGQKAERDAFWDNIQDFGNRTDYRYAFFHTGFTRIDPKYTVNAKNAESIMGGASNLVSVEWSKFNLSEVSSLYNAFGFCEKLTEIDTELCVAPPGETLCNSLFRACTSLKRVKKLTADPVLVWKNTFDECTALTDIIFDGTIGKSIIFAQSSLLSAESIQSIIDHLKDLTGGVAQTLTLHADVGAKLTEAQKATVTAKNWQLVY